MPQMRVSNSPNQECALTNCAFLSDADHSLLGPGGDVYVEMGGYVLTARADRRVEPGCVALNSIHRGMLSVSNGASIAVDVFSPSAAEKAGAAMVVFEVDYVLRQRGSGREIDAGELSKAFLARFALQYVTVNQPVVAEWQGDERAGGAALSGRFSEARRSRPRRRQPEADRHEPRGDPAGAGHRERRAQRRRSSPRPQQLLRLPPPMLRRGMPC